LPLEGIDANSKRSSCTKLAVLLDRANPQWRSRYFSEKFDNENYFKGPSALKN